MTRKLRQKAIVHRKTMDLCCRRRWRILVSQVVVVFTTKPKNYAAHAFQEGWSVDTLLLVLKISMEWPFHNMKGVCENWALDRPLFKLPKMLRFGSGPQSKSSKKLTQTFTSIFLCVNSRTLFALQLQETSFVFNEVRIRVGRQSGSLSLFLSPPSYFHPPSIALNTDPMS